MNFLIAFALFLLGNIFGAFFVIVLALCVINKECRSEDEIIKDIEAMRSKD